MTLKKLWLPILIAALCALLLLADSARSEPVDYAAMQAQMLDPTVEIGSRNMNSTREFCTGSIFHSDRDEASGEVLTLVMTAKHCTDKVDDPMLVSISTVGDDLSITATTAYSAVVAGFCSGQDVAYLRLDDTDTIFPTVRLAAKDTRLYEIEDVWAVGYPRGLTRTVTTGQLGLIETHQMQADWFTAIRDSAPIFGGNSGGPLFHRAADGGYEQIGITVAGWMDALHMAYSVPLEPMSKCVEDFMGREDRRLTRLAAEAGN